VTERDWWELGQFCVVGVLVMRDRVAHRRRALALAPAEDMSLTEMAALLPSLESLAYRMHLATQSERVPLGAAKCLRVQTLPK